MCGVAAGFTSFIAHAGSPPFQVYALPLKLHQRIYAGTKVMFFAVVNVVKILPFAFLGQLSPDNLTLSAALLPFAPLGVFAGAWANRRLPPRLFYGIIYALLCVVGAKLAYDGITGL